MEGKTSIAGRTSMVKEFQNTDDTSSRVLLMQIEVGKEGFNLQRASVVVIMDPSWNPQTEMQLIARSHRYGQVAPVCVYRLVSSGF